MIDGAHKQSWSVFMLIYLTRRTPVSSVFNRVDAPETPPVLLHTWNKGTTETMQRGN